MAVDVDLIAKPTASGIENTSATILQVNVYAYVYTLFYMHTAAGRAGGASVSKIQYSNER